MQRRQALGILGRMAVVPALSHLPLERLYALGRETHRRLGESPALRILDPHQHETVAAVAELIIPETDTPGAGAAGVSEFIDLILAEWYTEEQRARFLAGLVDLDRRSQALIGRVFLDAGASDQVRTLSELESEWLSLQAAGGKTDEHFFAQIKHLTIYGYYTSSVGLERELHWIVIPGRYDPCLATGIRMKGSS
jgi:glucoside 3-dehydrogenase (cytochrome c) hitch-hiker subunit